MTESNQYPKGETREERMKHPHLYWAHAMEGVECYLWDEMEVSKEEYEAAGGKPIPP